jgi:hypothetical protein
MNLVPFVRNRGGVCVIRREHRRHDDDRGDVPGRAVLRAVERVLARVGPRVTRSARRRQRPGNRGSILSETFFPWREAKPSGHP